MKIAKYSFNKSTYVFIFILKIKLWYKRKLRLDVSHKDGKKKVLKIRTLAL